MYKQVIFNTSLQPKFRFSVSLQPLGINKYDFLCAILQKQLS